MHELTSLVLGILQGLTEFIPVSSSGHLVIAEHFFGASDHTFLEFINIGTLAALLVYYRHEIAALYRQVVDRKDYRLLRNIILTSIPAGLAGLLLGNIISNHPFFTDIRVVVMTLAIVGAIMIALPRLPRAKPVAAISDLSPKAALAIGVAQMFALIPGVSRSGSTIIASQLSGLKPKDAADYSFIASIPIMLAVTLKLFVSGADRQYFIQNMPGLLLGNIAAFIVGMIAIKYLLRYLKNHGLQLFGWYRLALALLVLLLLAVGA